MRVTTYDNFLGRSRTSWHLQCFHVEDERSTIKGWKFCSQVRASRSPTFKAPLLTGTTPDSFDGAQRIGDRIGGFVCSGGTNFFIQDLAPGAEIPMVSPLRVSSKEFEKHLTAIIPIFSTGVTRLIISLFVSKIAGLTNESASNLHGLQFLVK